MTNRIKSLESIQEAAGRYIVAKEAFERSFKKINKPFRIIQMNAVRSIDPKYIGIDDIDGNLYTMATTGVVEDNTYCEINFMLVGKDIEGNWKTYISQLMPNIFKISEFSECHGDNFVNRYIEMLNAALKSMDTIQEILNESDYKMEYIPHLENHIDYKEYLKDSLFARSV